MTDENLDELMEIYASESAIRSAQREKESERVFDQKISAKDFPRPQRELDLHGFTVPDGMRELEYFIVKAIEHKLRTVRIITGKGLHSKNLKAVMPEATEKRLAELRRENKVMSFRREKTGGAFVVYLIS
jgi:DNA-nicking Smr family endonuclease